MTPSARLQAVLDLLSEIEKIARPADALVSAYFRARRYIGSHDRAAVSALTYTILRHHARLGWWVKHISRKKDRSDSLPLEGRVRVGGPQQGQSFQVEDNHLLHAPPPNLPHKGGGTTPSRLHLLAYLVLTEQKTVREIENLFNGEKFAPALLSDSERGLARALQKHTLEHPGMPDEVQTECPDWAAASLKKRFGKSFMREMRALLEPAPLDLRINPLKTTREEMLAALKKAGVKAKPCALSAFGIRVSERPSLAALPMLKDGFVEIQDEGSQLVAALVDAKPGMRVVDFCAGAGGKTLAISAQMNNKGRITACDVLEKRLKRSAERFRRAGLHNIETKPLKDERDPWVKKHKGTFDRVLVDAPCTGIGAWRRNPDARWRSLGPGLEALLPLQASILDSAARLAKIGGRLIYATCSLLPEENERQVEKFLETHKEFRLLDCSEIYSQSLGRPGKLSLRIAEGDTKESLSGTQYGPIGDYLSLTPAQHNTDGFFAAVMERG